jgi:hypothetical protein
LHNKLARGILKVRLKVPTVADYYPLISRAVADLPQNNREARDAIYERARNTLVGLVRGKTPTLSESELSRERRSLEEAISRVEEETYEKQRPLGVSFAATKFRNPMTIAKLLKTLLYISIALAVVAIGSGLLELQLLQDFEAGNYTASRIAAAAEANDLRQRIVGIGRIAILLITVIVFSRWIYVVHANKWNLDASGMRFTPGWAVGSFFIPFINLYQPYQAMKEVWLVSSNPLQWQQQRRSAILPWWWFFWLVNGVLGQASLRMSLSAKTLPAFIAANVMNEFAHCISIVAWCLALALVGKITRMQLDQKLASSLD